MGSDHAAHHMHFLFFDDLQDLHGTNLGTDAAGDTLGRGTAFLQDHNLHGARLNALAAGNAELLVDHVNAGLGVLSDSTVFADLCALTALDAGHRLCGVTLCNDLNAGIIGMELLVKSVGASLNTLEACHTLCTFFNHELLHN